MLTVEQRKQIWVEMVLHESLSIDTDEARAMRARFEKQLAETLSTEQLNTILVEVVLGAPLSIPGEEAKRMRVLLEKEVAEMRARGEGIAIPNGFPSADPVRLPPKA